MIRALILDFDGLLVDTETPALQSWQQVYTEYGYTLTLDLWQRALGSNDGFKPLDHLVDLLQRQSPSLSPDRAAVVARQKALRDQFGVAQPLLPGVVELLDQADALALPCAVASSSSRAWVEGWLRRFGLLARFVSLSTADNVVQTKPAPDVFLHAATCLEVPPAHCLVFEDSPNGILAAQAAGMPCVAVPGAVAGLFELPPSDLVLAALNTCPLAEILDQIRGSD